MFAVGDYVIYGYEGVCRIDEIGSPGVSGFDRGRQYYRLTPHYRGGTIYAPVDGRVRMRRVISREALRLCKTFREKQKRQAAAHRSINSTELRSWKTAEEMLYGEFGFVLGIAPNDVPRFLSEAMS